MRSCRDCCCWKLTKAGCQPTRHTDVCVAACVCAWQRQHRRAWACVCSRLCVNGQFRRQLCLVMSGRRTQFWGDFECKPYKINYWLTITYSPTRIGLSCGGHIECVAPWSAISLLRPIRSTWSVCANVRAVMPTYSTQSRDLLCCVIQFNCINIQSIKNGYLQFCWY